MVVQVEARQRQADAKTKAVVARVGGMNGQERAGRGS